MFFIIRFALVAFHQTISGIEKENCNSQKSKRLENDAEGRKRINFLCQMMQNNDQGTYTTDASGGLNR